MRPAHLIYEYSSTGRSGVALPQPDPDAPMVSDVIPADELRADLPLPEVSQNDVMRHYVGLSQKNFCIDTDMYPLGSCTMKYNPKVNEVTARLPGLAAIHPWQPDAQVQGALELLYELERLISAITGFAAITLQPAAGAQGEFTGMMIIRAHLLHTGKRRSKVLIPDSAHGTNPATAAMCGYDVVGIPTDERGELDVNALEASLDDEVAGIMMTVPNTLGLFESRIERICELTHDAGGYVYCDGANMNAMVGWVRPAELGIDVMHLNLHKTFSTPHGGGGPGAGALCVTGELEPYLPTPKVVRNEDGSFERRDDFPQSIGRLHGSAGNFGNLVRAYTYIRSLGDSGLREVGELAVLNANYLRTKLSDLYEPAYDRTCMHEVVFAGLKDLADGIHTLDVAKRLIDFGFHPPTIYFPLIVGEALMIEPTETESVETLDRFVDAMRQIAHEARDEPDLLKEAPTSTPVRRLDETRAARRPNVRWTPDSPG